MYKNSDLNYQTYRDELYDINDQDMLMKMTLMSIIHSTNRMTHIIKVSDNMKTIPTHMI